MDEFTRHLYDLAEVNIWPLLYADPAREVIAIDNYTYSAEIMTGYNGIVTPALSAAKPQSVTIPMGTDTDFVLTYMSACGQLTTDNNIYPNAGYSVQITDLSSGRTFFNQPLPAPMVGGYAGFPFLLSEPYVIQARASLKLDFAVLQNGGTFDGVFFALHGSRIYYRN